MECVAALGSGLPVFDDDGKGDGVRPRYVFGLMFINGMWEFGRGLPVELC